MRNKVTVVGAGNVGASCALRLADKELADVVLVDIVEHYVVQRDSLWGLDVPLHGLERGGGPHRSAEFIEFLELADAHYPAGARIRLVLDNHSAHISKQTRAFLKTLPNRFEFTFTPKHGSWLNLIESFFGKMAKTVLRGIRVDSSDELKRRIELYLKEVNETPVVFRWKYKLDTLSLV